MRCCVTRRRNAAPPSQNYEWLSLALRTHTLDRAHSSASNKIHQKNTHMMQRDATLTRCDATCPHTPTQLDRAHSSHEKSNHNSAPYPPLAPPQHKKVITTPHTISHRRRSVENKKRKLSWRRPIIDSQLLVVVGESNNQLFRFLF
jgi:hypothetical protein